MRVVLDAIKGFRINPLPQVPMSARHLADGDS